MKGAPPSYLSGPASRPSVSLELRVILAATLYGAVVGALVASALWWWLG